MCGIVGVLGAQSADDGRRIVERMNAAIVHRGPDDAGLWCDERTAVGMRRLSIIDLAGGHQPMATDDGVVIVFNGEIYNYRKLRAQLERAGYVFRTQSDTEVVLNLYHHGGLDALKRLEGMFGICLVDTRFGKVHLLRDRLGIKPLYYGSFGGRFYFASEIKAIIAALDTRPPVDTRGLYHYLTLRFVPQSATIWEGVHKLQPGWRLSYDLASGAFQREAYWSLNFRAERLDPGRDYEREFSERFLAAVESHLLTADVPVGTLLSGGLDSSAVTAAAAELGIRGIHTFSVAFAEGGEYSELAFARETAAHIGAQHHEVVIDRADFIDFLEDFTWFSDEPLADLASIPLYYVSRLAREHVKVVISGEGADEIFAGYNLEQDAALADRRRRLYARLPRRLYSLAARFFSGRRAQTLRTMGAEGWAGYLKAWATHPTSNWSEGEKRALWRAPARPDDSEDLIRSFYDACDSDEPLDRLQAVASRDWLVEDLLMKADKMTMANSIELRVPFLAHPLVEWAQKLPISWRTGDARVGYVSKRILREFARKRLPASIINRPKRGFPVPAYEWLKGPLVDWARERLLRTDSLLNEWLNLSAAEPALTAARAGNVSAAHKVWNLLVLDAWARRWLG